MRKQLLLTKLILLIVACSTGVMAESLQQSQGIVLGFDGLADLAANVDSLGIHFTGATVLACGGALNCGQFPPVSGRNVIYDTTGLGGVITATFDSTVGFVDKVTARITGNRNITMTGFDKNGAVLESSQTGGANYVGAGTGLSPNSLLTVSSTTASIAKVTFHDGGNTFTIDDFTFFAKPHVIVLDAGHGQLRDASGELHYQRQPTPNLQLIEDIMALQITKIARDKLVADGYQVYLTRTTDLAPISVAGRECWATFQLTNVCNDDLKLRVDATKAKVETGHVIFVSIHTNGSPQRGTLMVQCSPDSTLLSQQVGSSVRSAISTQDRGIRTDCEIGLLKRLSEDQIQNTLAEVASHGGFILGVYLSADEALLADPTNRVKAGNAIAKGIQDYIKEIDGN